MTTISKTIFVFSLLLISVCSSSQGKYFEVACEKGAFSGTLVGSVRPLNNQPYVILNFKGKNKKELLKLIQRYLKNRPALKLDHIDSSIGSVVVYRDFANIGTKEKCFADLVALSYLYATPEDGLIKINLGMTSHIFATIFDAKLQISPDGDVASDGDLPFNEYKFVQPADEKVLTSNMWVGAHSRNRELKSAYPDSVFDPKGKVINAINKNLIESFFDGYVADLRAFVDAAMK